MPTPQIECYTLGPFATNCYIVRIPGRDECWIVDASFGPQPLIDRVRQLGLRPQSILLTHAHADHIAGLEEVRAAFPDVPASIHSAEAEFLTNPVLNLSAGFPPSIRCRPADSLLRGGERLEFAGTTWQVLHTPGHSPGGISLHCAESRLALVGDTLFFGSIGRYDFPTSDGPALERSIREVLYKLPDDTTCFPGHGPSTTIGREKASNPFVRA